MAEPDLGDKGNGNRLECADSELDFGRVPKGTLITGDGGEVEIPKHDRPKIAIFRNGLAVVAHEYRWSAEVKAVLDRAERIGLNVNQIKAIESQKILGIYKSEAQVRHQKATRLTGIERQRELRNIITNAANQQSSDVHIQVHSSFCEIRVRVHGRLRPLCSLEPEEGRALINAAFAVATDQGSEMNTTAFLKGSLTASSGLLPPGVELVRMQYSPTTGHHAALVMRIKYTTSDANLDLEHLGFDARQIADIAIMRRRTGGLYLLAGKVSSGKTTTLQRILNRMVREKNHEISIYSIEEPVELNIDGAVHVGIFSKPNQSRVEAFIEAVRAALRSDPNVVVLGELRDRELAGHAIELALTGHALWSTVHAGSALGILDRLNDLGIEFWKLTEPSVIRGLIFQRLLGQLCPHCRITVNNGLGQRKITETLLLSVTELLETTPDHVFIRGPGCKRCNHGLVGRTVVAETVLPDLRLLQHYSDGNRKAMREYWLEPVTNGGCGGNPILHHALMKVGRGLCDINEVEEEIDLVQTYRRDFPHHALTLAQDCRALNHG